MLICETYACQYSLNVVQQLCNKDQVWQRTQELTLDMYVYGACVSVYVLMLGDQYRAHILCHHHHGNRKNYRKQNRENKVRVRSETEMGAERQDGREGRGGREERGERRKRERLESCKYVLWQPSWLLALLWEIGGSKANSNKSKVVTATTQQQ